MPAGGPAILAVADRREPAAARAFVEAVGQARGGTFQQKLQGLLERGQTGQAFAVAEGAWNSAVPEWRAAVAKQMRDAVEAGADVAKGAAPKLVGAFDVTNPQAVAWARQHSAQLVTAVSDETRKGIQSVVTRTIELGLPPADAAKRIQGLVGLNARQAAALEGFRSRLPADMAPATAARQVDQYGAKLLRQRAQTIARTEIMSALNVGQRLLWGQAVEADELDPDAMERVWIVTEGELGAHPVCDDCAAMDGETAPIDGTYLDGVEGPPLHPNCRCTEGLQAIPKAPRTAAKTMPKRPPQEPLAAPQAPAAFEPVVPVAPPIQRAPTPPAGPPLVGPLQRAPSFPEGGSANWPAGALPQIEPPPAPVAAPRRPAVPPNVVAPARPAKPGTPVDANGNSPAQAAMAAQKVTATRPLGGGIHATFKATLEDGSAVVLKPARYIMEGDQMGQGAYTMLKEAAARDVAEEVGMADMVPLTTVLKAAKTGKYGDSSAQAFMSGFQVAYKADPAWRQATPTRDLWRAKMFDQVLENTDRHNGNWMVNQHGDLALIDNGFIMNSGHYNQMPTPPGQIPADIVAAWVQAKPAIAARLQARGIKQADIDQVLRQIDFVERSRTVV